MIHAVISRNALAASVAAAPILDRNPATVRRLTRAKALADAILDAFAAGRTGQSLRDLFRGAPYDFDATDEGTSLRMYGLQTPPQDNQTLAMLCWAKMALGLGA